jgi:hypothetical protein
MPCTRWLLSCTVWSVTILLHPCTLCWNCAAMAEHPLSQAFNSSEGAPRTPHPHQYCMIHSAAPVMIQVSTSPLSALQEHTAHKQMASYLSPSCNYSPACLCSAC